MKIHKISITNSFHYLSILIGALLLSGCGSKEPPPSNSLLPNSITDTIYIDPDQDATKSWNMDIELIKLELTPNSLLNEFELYKYYNGRYYVRSNQENSIVCFDSTGQYLYRIHRPGKGKGEYKDIRYFEFDRDQNALFILDIDRNRVIYYDLQKGDFLYEELYINKMASIYRIHDWEYVYSAYAGYKLDYVTLYNLYFHNLNNPAATSHRYFPYSRNTDIVMSADPLKYYDNDTLIYNEKYDNTIYHLKDSLFIPRYYVDFGSANIPNDYNLEVRDPLEIYDDIKDKGFANLVSVVDHPLYLHFSYRYKGHVRMLFYNTASADQYVFDTLSVAGMKLYNAYIAGSTPEWFWGNINASQLLKDNPDHPQVRSLEIDENSNPVIFKIKPR